ncbi:MAG: hypothetical protein ACR2KC_05970 [Acidimicrobiales bacterium]
MSTLPGLPWMEGLDHWRKEVTTELRSLPETLRMLREGVDNFQRITKRLLDITDGLEQVTRLYVGGISDARKRVEDVNRALQKQVASPASEVVVSAVTDLGEALAAMARLNPLWPRLSSASAASSGGGRGTHGAAEAGGEGSEEPPISRHGDDGGEAAPAAQGQGSEGADTTATAAPGASGSSRVGGGSAQTGGGSHAAGSGNAAPPREAGGAQKHR